MAISGVLTMPEYLFEMTELDELRANLEYLNSRCELVIKLLDFMENVSQGIRRYDLDPNSFSEYYSFLHKVLLTTETERAIIQQDYAKEKFIRGYSSESPKAEM